MLYEQRTDIRYGWKVNANFLGIQGFRILVEIGGGALPPGAEVCNNREQPTFDLALQDKKEVV